MIIASAKTFDQAVDLVVGGFSVISCDLVGHVVGQHVLFQVLHAFFDLPGNPDRIAALFLGHRNGNRRERSAARHLATVIWMGRSETYSAVGKNLLGAVLHLGDIPQIDGPALVKGDEQVPDLMDILDKGARFDPNHLIGFFIFTALHLGI